MQLYNYIAKTKSGEIQQGDVEAENEVAAAKVLASKGLTTIGITAATESKFGALGRISLKDKVQVARQLATMIAAGLPLSRSLVVLEDQVSNKKLKKIISQVSGEIEGGSTLSAAFGKFPDLFTPLDITLISSGETSGSLDKALLRLADQLEKELSLVRKIRGALIYPVLLVVVVIAVTIVMVTYVMPQMEELYKSFNANLPFLTRAMIAVSNFIAKFFPFLLLISIGVGAYIRIAIKKPAGRKVWDSFKLKIPPFNKLVLMAYMVRFSNTLSGLVAAGVPLLDALHIVSRAVGNIIYEESIKKSAEKVKSGVALSETLRGNPLFPPVVPQMISVGEETGELDSMLENLGRYFEEQLEVTVKSVSELLQPVIIIVLGIIICVLLVAIMLPIYSLGGVITK